ncbi:MAG: sigma-70 family RNA polymerase sigma factor [Anaerolineae bacterium]
MSNHNILSGSLTDTELQTLWRHAWLIASRLCRGTLIRLRSGRGGLYDDSDFHQDAFLVFRALALRWAAGDPRPPEDDLWSAWRRCLWHNGSSILRRPPQRLWGGSNTPEMDPEELADDPSGCKDTGLARAASEQLVCREDPEQLVEASEHTAESRKLIARALAALPPSQRTLITWIVIEERPVAEVAARLGVSRGAVYSRLSRALAALRREARSRGLDGPAD